MLDAGLCSNGIVASEIGLEFERYCYSNIIGSDLPGGKIEFQTSFDDCLQLCANYANKYTERCMALNYNYNAATCRLKSSNASTSNLIVDRGAITAFADPTAFEGRRTDCPYANGTVEVDRNGMQYQILCETDQIGDLLDATEPSEFFQPFHADTMLDCLNYCSVGSSLCYGVVYIESLATGYRNCFAKGANASSKPENVERYGNATLAMGLLSIANTSCSNGLHRTSTGTEFNVTCDYSTSDGDDLNRIHTDTLEECIEVCAEYEGSSENGTCWSAVYEPRSLDGFLNCHLKSRQPLGFPLSNWRVAVRIGTETSSGDSNAWIAGAVAGPIVGVALVVGVAFWWRRRRRSTRRPLKQADSSGLKTETSPSPPAPHYKQELDATSGPLLPSGQQQNGDVAELPGSEGRREELPT